MSLLGTEINGATVGVRASVTASERFTFGVVEELMVENKSNNQARQNKQQTNKNLNNQEHSRLSTAPHAQNWEEEEAEEAEEAEEKIKALHTLQPPSCATTKVATRHESNDHTRARQANCARTSTHTHTHRHRQTQKKEDEKRKEAMREKVESDLRLVKVRE